MTQMDYFANACSYGLRTCNADWRVNLLKGVEQTLRSKIAS